MAALRIQSVEGRLKNYICSSKPRRPMGWMDLWSPSLFFLNKDQEYKENIYKEPEKRSHPEKVYAGKQTRPRHWTPSCHKAAGRSKWRPLSLSRVQFYAGAIVFTLFCHSQWRLKRTIYFLSYWRNSHICRSHPTPSTPCGRGNSPRWINSPGLPRKTRGASASCSERWGREGRDRS